MDDVPLTRLVELAPIALASASEQRAAIVLSVLGDLLRQSAASDLFLSEATESGETVAAAIAARTASDSASLLAIGGAVSETSTKDHRDCIVASLLRHMHRRLAAAGVTFVQAMREPESSPTELTRCGYERLATLDYLLATRVEPIGNGHHRLAHGSYRFIPFEEFFGAERSREQLVDLVEATYVGSLDCPKIGEHRSASAVLDSYCQSSSYDPHGWQILADAAGHVCGCLLTTPHRQTGSLEITYMGLVPQSRRRGYASAIIDRAWKIADAYGLPQLTAAVDQQNHPAMGLYRRHGFEVLMSEAVWGLSLAAETAHRPVREIPAARETHHR